MKSAKSPEIQLEQFSNNIYNYGMELVTVRPVSCSLKKSIPNENFMIDNIVRKELPSYVREDSILMVT
jgi:hypothetical protein